MKYVKKRPEERKKPGRKPLPFDGVRCELCLRRETVAALRNRGCVGTVARQIIEDYVERLKGGSR